MGVAPEKALHGLDNLGHAGHAAHQNHLVYLAGVDPSVFERRFAGRDGLFHQVVHQGLELGAGELDVEMLGARLVGGDKGQVNLGLLRGGKFDFSLFRGLLEALQGQFVLAQVYTLFLLELVGEIIDDALVEVLASEKGVAVGGLDLEHAVTDFQERDIESAAAEIEHGDEPAFLFLKPIGERRGGGFINDAQNLQSRNFARVLGGLALRIVEIGRHGDNRLFHCLAEIVFGGFLHLLQDERADLARRIGLTLGFDPGIAVFAADDGIGNHAFVLLDDGIVETAANQALDGKERIFRVGHALALGGLAHQAFVFVAEGDHGRRGARALHVLDYLGILAVHNGDTGIGGSQINADYLAHAHPL